METEEREMNERRGRNEGRINEGSMREQAGRTLLSQQRVERIDRLILPEHDDTFNNGEMPVSCSSWTASDRHNLRD